MLVRLLYASRAAVPPDAETLQGILRPSRLNNPAQGITGVLCVCSASGVYLQVLEGGRGAVNRLYQRIVTDRRHGDVELLSYEEIVERRFNGWAMGQVDMSRLNPALLLKYSEKPRLDPFAMPASASMALLLELMATASVVGSP
ncbi:BLUF domain-containing protein [Pseudorhodoferax sp.]|uniref:BLUF domain-containing protein n=1 Tax=Pseudorhodoferax sp. TaxID=1993553 RepID=UPI002DD67B11|nr:BLUF domain-containing protein [Pseudorhodoferax sp.]